MGCGLSHRWKIRQPGKQESRALLGNMSTRVVIMRAIKKNKEKGRKKRGNFSPRGTRFLLESTSPPDKCAQPSRLGSVCSLQRVLGQRGKLFGWGSLLGGCLCDPPDLLYDSVPGECFVRKPSLRVPARKYIPSTRKLSRETTCMHRYEYVPYQTSLSLCLTPNSIVPKACSEQLKA